MTLDALWTLLPLIVLSATILVVLLAAAVCRGRRLIAGLTMFSLVLSLGALAGPLASHSPQVPPLLVVDDFALFTLCVIFVTALVVAILSQDYLRGRPDIPEEFFLLLLTATLGCAVLACSNHFAPLILGLELLSVSLYVLIGYFRSEPERIEAALKYLVPGATSAALLLLGMACVYAASGTMTFPGLAAMVRQGNPIHPLIPAGLALITAGLGFKLALVPFHLWAADVYQGSPTPVTAFIATASKGAVIAVLLRFFLGGHAALLGPAFQAMAAVSVVTMLAGNLLALWQGHIKRLLAYSSIAHMGYILVAFLAGDLQGAAAATFYLTAYILTLLGAFGVLSVLSGKQQDPHAIGDCQGLAFSHPFLAGVFTVMLFSLAGIPLTAGFMGKFYVLAASVHRGLWGLALVLVLTSVMGLFYYLRVVVAVYSRPSQAPPPDSAPLPSSSWLSVGVLGVLTLMVVCIGVYPQPLIGWIGRVTRVLLETPG